ncbi:MAG: DUF3307 domain-containing protein, partial [bacterium]|nr:DUF3307 domain-containing protein [bacterium]
HFVADYPLQSDGMVKAKKTLPGLLLHGTVHLVVSSVLLFAVLGLDAGRLWPYPAAVALIHLVIDVLKNLASKRWPSWIVGSYLVDQALHVTTILGVAWWYEQGDLEALSKQHASWILPAIAFVVVTHFAWITEKICVLTDKQRLVRTLETGFVRMVSRAVLLGALLIGATPWGALTLLCGLFYHVYDTRDHLPRVLALDSAWVIGVFLFLRLAG